MRPPTALGPHRPQPSSTIVTLETQLVLRRRRDAPAFLVAALRLRRRFTESDGGVSLDLEAHPLRRTFLTRSSWRDEEAMDAFTADPLHREVMRTFRDRMAGSTFRTSTSPIGERNREQMRASRR